MPFPKAYADRVQRLRVPGDCRELGSLVDRPVAQLAVAAELVLAGLAGVGGVPRFH